MPHNKGRKRPAAPKKPVRRNLAAGKGKRPVRRTPRKTTNR